MGKILILSVALVILIIICLIPDFSFGQLPIGVKQGNWIEYHVTVTGNPPEEHNVTWARLEILSVEGNEIRINSTSEARNRTVTSLLMTLNVEKGQIGAWWIIPANLNPGEMFYDQFLDQNLTIDGQQQLEYAGAIRTITNTTVPDRVKRWDKVTGIFVLSADVLTEYTINVDAYDTNMWSPQIFGIDEGLFYAFVISIVAIVAVALVLFIYRRSRLNEVSK